MNIRCQIGTPQFHGRQDSYYMFIQTGTYNTDTHLFTADRGWLFNGLFGGNHDVQFKDYEDFKKALKRILR